jgi:hypothetical protein
MKTTLLIISSLSIGFFGFINPSIMIGQAIAFVVSLPFTDEFRGQA